MIIACLKGGLGNQMFQYAAARRLAYHHNTELKLDLSLFNSCQTGFTPRSYQLANFNIQATVASSREVAEITGKGISYIESKLKHLRQLTGFSQSSYSVFKEHHFHFDQSVFDLPDNTYMDGYWQSERYFKDIADVIRQDFFVVTLPGEKNVKLADYISTVSAVSLHVRRGDYVTNPTASRHHGVCSSEYYRKAVALILQSVDNPHLFVFSDEPDWCASHLRLPAQTHFVNHNNNNPHDDLRLMRLCRHHIIANSSFSWWGAWLSSSPNKIVICPKKWFNNTRRCTNDLIPEKWLCI